jgi:hypothetical protein
MRLFCTNCGAAVSATTRFCTACGAVCEIAEDRAPAAPTPRASDIVDSPKSPNANTKPRRTWPWWTLVVIAFFLLGLWLGRGPAAKKPVCGAPATVQGGAGPLVQGPGAPLKVGRGGPGEPPSLSGGGDGKNPSGSGVGGLGKAGDEDLPGGGGGGKARSGDDDSTPPSKGEADRIKGDLTRYIDGNGSRPGDGDEKDADAPSQGKSYHSNDFTYDKTHLPRYPHAVSSVVSSIIYPPDGKTDTYHTGAGIVTSSSFETVVSWYRQNLPPGWHDMTIGDMQQLSKQLSAQSLMQMVGAQPPSDPAAPSAAAAMPSAEPIRISLFSPPTGSKDKIGVMIVQHGKGQVEALLQAQVAP